MTAIDHDPRPLPRDNDNLFTHALGGARISRLGEVTLVMIQGEGAFAAPAREFGIARRWAETRPRRATAARSREALLDRLDAVLAGSGISLLTACLSTPTTSHAIRMEKS